MLALRVSTLSNVVKNAAITAITKAEAKMANTLRWVFITYPPITSPWDPEPRVPSGPYLLCRLLELIQGWALNISSPPGLVAVIGAENAGRAPANSRMDGAAHARASPFAANYLPQGTCCSSAAGDDLPGLRWHRISKNQTVNGAGPQNLSSEMRGMSGQGPHREARGLRLQAPK
jgi:hypothetical protein